MSNLTDVPVARGRLGIVRCAATGALAFGAFFVPCWIGAATGVLNASHMYIALFTTAPVGSVGALAIGLGWSIVVGALGGSLIALAYNALAFLDR